MLVPGMRKGGSKPRIVRESLPAGPKAYKGQKGHLGSIGKSREIHLAPEHNKREMVFGCKQTRGREMTIGTVLMLLLILALIGVSPTWEYSRDWGYKPLVATALLLLATVIWTIAKP